MPNNFQIPDLTKICWEHFELRVNQHCRAVGEESRRWMEQHGLLVDDEAREQYSAAQLPLLASLFYPTCDMTQLRTATDLMTMLLYGSYHVKSLNELACQAAFER